MKVRKLKKLQQRKVFYAACYKGVGLFAYSNRYGNKRFNGKARFPSGKSWIGTNWGYV